MLKGMYPVFICSPMSVRYFTVKEANEALTEIKPLMRQLLDTQAKAVRKSREIEYLLHDSHVDFGGAVPSELMQDFALIEDLLNQVRSFGCIVKNLEAGLIDFLAKIDGRDVYLCWRFGEDRITYYHELHTGFKGRIALD